MSSDIASVEIERLRERVEQLEFWLSTLIRSIQNEDNSPSKRPVAALRTKGKKVRRSRA